jgi:hypothetical protein
MNLINTILILIIVVIFLNYFTENKLFYIIKKYLNSCKSNVENFMGITYNINTPYNNTPNIPFVNQKDFGYNLTNKHSMKQLYFFVNSFIKPNLNMYELTRSDSKQLSADNKLEYEILNYIIKTFNCYGYTFYNIKILDKIFYYTNPRGFEIEPFNFSSEIYYNSNLIDTFIFNIELFLRNDINYQSKQFSILSIKLINESNKNKIKNKAKKDVIKMNKEMNNTFDSIFIKNNKIINNDYDNDSDNSIIPSNIQMSNDSTNATDTSST